MISKQTTEDREAVNTVVRKERSSTENSNAHSASCSRTGMGGAEKTED